MLGKAPNQDQLALFKATLKQIIDPKHPLVSLAHAIPCKTLEDKFEHLYSYTGAPSHHLRKMIGITLLQRIYNLSDERVVESWIENPYFQYFCREAVLQWQQPCAASDLVHFRKRLGKKGIQALFALSVHMHANKLAKAKQVLVDTTVQEKNITFPTDAKLYKKVIARCNTLAQRAGVELRQSYRYVAQKLFYAQRYVHLPRHVKKASKALKRLKTLAARQVRDLQRKLEAIGKLSLYGKELSLMDRIVKQARKDKEKIYSLSSPEVSCIAKGKVGKKYEFGSKVSVAMLAGSNVVVGVESFSGNPHDSKTLPLALDSIREKFGKEFSRVIVDRGYRGQVKVGTSEVILPGGCRAQSAYARRQHKLRCRRRSGIEAIIGHLKSDHRLGRNYLKGSLGDSVNALLAGIGFNLRLLLREVAFLFSYSMDLSMKTVRDVSENFLLASTRKSY